MKFPTYEEMAQNVAEKVLDEYEYNGKTLREWIEIILATDTNVATKVGTNLAEVGTDCSEFPNNSDTISRKAAIDAVARVMVIKSRGGRGNRIAEAVDSAKIIIVDNILHLPPIQPKRGRWISADAIFGGVPFYCSECGENTRDTVMGKPRWNFCPNCGADMRGEQDG